MYKHARSAFLYAVLAMLFGVFFREFTKIIGYSGKTTLSLVHTHYFALGMLFFLLVAILDEKCLISSQKIGRLFPLFYHIGLNITALMLFVRGLIQVVAPDITLGIGAALSGIAGIGHALLGTGLVLFFVTLLRQTKNVKVGR